MCLFEKLTVMSLCSVSNKKAYVNMKMLTLPVPKQSLLACTFIVTIIPPLPSFPSDGTSQFSLICSFAENHSFPKPSM